MSNSDNIKKRHLMDNDKEHIINTTHKRSLKKNKRDRQLESVKMEKLHNAEYRRYLDEIDKIKYRSNDH